MSLRVRRELLTPSRLGVEWKPKGSPAHAPSRVSILGSALLAYADNFRASGGEVSDGYRFKKANRSILRPPFLWELIMMRNLSLSAIENVHDSRRRRRLVADCQHGFP